MGHLFFSSNGRINRRAFWQGVVLSTAVVLASWVASAYLSKRAASVFGQEQAKTHS